MTTDLSSIVFVFPCDDGSFDLLPFFWLPEANIRRMEVRLAVPLQKWASEGFLELSQGEVIDYRDIEARLRWGAEMFDLQEICWDPWNSRQISVPMIEDGFHCIEIRQGYRDLSEPTKKLLELVANGALHHGNHPVLRWHAYSATLVRDGKDNIMFAKPERERAKSRIDGLSATVNAMARAMVPGGNSVYESRGVVAI